MTKLRGPLFSTSAHGRVNNAVVIQQRGATGLLYRRAKPRNPRSQPQMRHRSFISALTQAWSFNWSTVTQEWANWHPNDQSSPYHKYLACNFERLANNLWPTVRSPDVPPLTPKAWTSYEWSAKTRAIGLHGHLIAPASPAFVVIWLGPGVAPHVGPQNNCRLLAIATNPFPFTYALHVTPGDHYAYAKQINLYGLANDLIASGWLTIPA